MQQNTGQHPDPHKILLRRQLRSRRNSLSSDLRARHDAAIGQHVLHLVRSRGAGSIACYWPFNGEPDITQIYQQWAVEGRALALPVISGDDDHRMDFHSWLVDTDLGKNRYGILEPQKTAPVPLSGIDMLIMPLVGYDRFGNRLGLGSGYYDRCLESVRDKPVPMRVGIAYSLQEVEALDKDEWDISIHGVVNENGWFTLGGRESLKTIKED